MYFILTVVGALLASSLAEYLLHKIYLHRPEHIHIIEHHGNFQPQKSMFMRNEIELDEVFSGVKYMLANFLLYLPFGILLFSQSIFLGVLFLSIGALYTVWIEVAHFYFHHVDGKKLEKFKIFAYLKQNHKVHHAVHKVNFGIGSNFWDHLLNSRQASWKNN